MLSKVQLQPAQPGFGFPFSFNFLESWSGKLIPEISLKNLKVGEHLLIQYVHGIRVYIKPTGYSCLLGYKSISISSMIQGNVSNLYFYRLA